jgi:hypothetical protein
MSIHLDKKNVIIFSTLALCSSFVYYIYVIQQTQQKIKNVKKKSLLVSNKFIKSTKKELNQKKELCNKRVKKKRTSLLNTLNNTKPQKIKLKPKMPKTSPPVRFYLKTTEYIIPTLILIEYHIPLKNNINIEHISKNVLIKLNHIKHNDKNIDIDDPILIMATN